MQALEHLSQANLKSLFRHCKKVRFPMNAGFYRCLANVRFSVLKRTYPGSGSIHPSKLCDLSPL